MISMYLNSLYSFIRYNNPVVVTWIQFYKTLKAFCNLQRNMKRSHYRLAMLNERLATMENYINQPQKNTTSRLDMHR